MNIVIIDNDIESRNSLSKLLRLFCSNINIVGCSGWPGENLDILQNSDPDLVFLDSEIYRNYNPTLYLKSSKKVFHTVLLSDGESTVEDLGLLKSKRFDWLRKPVDANALTSCVKIAETKLKKQLCPEHSSFNISKKVESERIGIPTSKGTLFVALNQIVYLKASNNYTEIILEEGKPILVSKTLKSFEILLEGTFFMRVHQSYLVNLGKVKELQRTDGGALILNNDVKIPISRANKLQIKKRLEEAWKIV